MKELVVISGKGGTGKTSIAASLAVLAGRCVVADCDVDAADLHLVLSPTIKERHDFYSGRVAVIRMQDCTGCGICQTHCRFDAVVSSIPSVDGGPYGARYDCANCDYCERSCPAQANAMIRTMSETFEAGQGTLAIDPIACEGCGVCVRLCPAQAIDFPERLSGEWFISDTRCGPMVHAKLGIAQGNSGKLVSVVRREARRIAQEGYPLVIVDGSPGIGCPVIASITGADRVLAITEPTPSGEHDLERIMQLVRHFGVSAMVCINKWDINPAVSERIAAYCREHSILLASRIRHDNAFTRAQLEGRAVVETRSDGVAADIHSLWTIVRDQMADL